MKLKVITLVLSLVIVIGPMSAEDKGELAGITGITGLWVGTATYNFFPSFRNSVSLLVVESGETVIGYLFLGVVTAKGFTYPAFKLQNVSVKGKRITAEVEGDQDPFDNFRPGIDKAKATVKFDKKKNTLTGTWEEIGFIGRSGTFNLTRREDPSKLGGVYGGRVSLDGKKYNLAFQLVEEEKANSENIFYSSPINVTGFQALLKVGQGIRLAGGGILGSCTRKGNKVTLQGPAGSFSGRVINNGAKLKGTFTDTNGEKGNITLLNQGLKKTVLPVLSSIRPKTISSGKTKVIKIKGKNFGEVLIPTVSKRIVTITDFKMKDSTLNVTLKASASATPGSSVKINILDQAGRSAKKSLTLKIK